MSSKAAATNITVPHARWLSIWVAQEHVCLLCRKAVLLEDKGESPEKDEEPIEVGRTYRQAYIAGTDTL